MSFSFVQEVEEPNLIVFIKCLCNGFNLCGFLLIFDELRKFILKLDTLFFQY